MKFHILQSLDKNINLSVLKGNHCNPYLRISNHPHQTPWGNHHIGPFC